MRRTMMTSLVAAAVLLGGACSDGDVEVTPAQTPTSDAIVVEPTEVPTAVPTATPEPPEPTAVPTTAPTAVPELTDDEQAAVAAWDRYFRLATEARDLDPGPEALDIPSYATGDLAAEFGQRVADERAMGIYWTGAVLARVDDVETRVDGAIVVTGCLTVDLEERSSADDALLSTLERSTITRARADQVDGMWLLGAVEVGAEPCS